MFHPYLRSSSFVSENGLTRERAENAPYFTPLQLKQIYNFPPSAASSARVPIVVVSFGGGLFGTLDEKTNILTNSDVQTYFRQLSITNMPIVKIITIDDAKNNPQSNDGATVENSLDIEIIGACVPNSEITLIIAPNTMDGFIKVFQKALELNPVVISCSWGLPETAAPSSFLLQVNAIFAQIVARGINICAAAGDNGSGDGLPGTNADFPSSSPWVVSCGGTTLISPTNAYTAQTQETVWNNNSNSSATGGGKSVVFAKPDYQAQQTGTGRLVPDVAMVANPNTGVLVFVDNTQFPIGGTSCVAPFMAGFLAYIGCNTFANPLLYSAPYTCFHDIVSGNNGAYKAGRGYDLCSGLGSINGNLLKIAFANPVAVTYSLAPTQVVFNARSSTSQLLLVPSQQSNGVLPDNTWTSSNPAVATVNASGLVTAINNGTCVVSNSLTSKTTTIQVRIVTIAVSKIVLTPSVRVGESMVLACTFTPGNATNKNLSFVSNQPSVATVQAGVVTGVSPGLATITATSASNANVRASLNVSVSQ